MCAGAHARGSDFNPRSRTGSDCGQAGGQARGEISTHAPRTGSDGTRTDAHAPPCISTHAPRTGSDDCQVVRHFFLKVFQPTLPARGATPQPSCPRTWQGHFNPRSPHGERRRLRFSATRGDSISTHAPRTGSDTLRCNKFAAHQISTHAPRTGSDTPCRRRSPSSGRFQPTLPARGATWRVSIICSDIAISTHAPRTGSDMLALASPIQSQ